MQFKESLEVIVAIVARVLGTSIEEVSESRFDSLNDWDSLRFIEVVFQVEEEFGVQFEEADIAGMFDPSSIALAVERARVL